MTKVICSEQALQSLQSLTPSVREELELRLDYVSRMPRMYAVTTDERFPGCRSFWVEPCYRVFYMVAAGGDDVYLTAVLEEDVQQLQPDADR